MDEKVKTNDWCWNLRLYIESCVCAALLVSWGMDVLSVSFLPDTGWGLFSAKLTFLSILFASAWLQYDYFYKEMTRVMGEWFPTWDGWIAFKRSTDETENRVYELDSATAGVLLDFVIKTKDQVQENRVQLQNAEEERKKLILAVDQGLRHFLIALSLVFGVIVTLFLSVVADWLYLALLPNPVFLSISHGSFTVTLLIFFGLLGYYTAVVNRQLNFVRASALNYKRVRFH